MSGAALRRYGRVRKGMGGRKVRLEDEREEMEKIKRERIGGRKEGLEKEREGVEKIRRERTGGRI